VPVEVSNAPHRFCRYDRRCRLSINAEGKITRSSIVYDSRGLSGTIRHELAVLALEPLQ
jgi:hypothetical protein